MKTESFDGRDKPSVLVTSPGSPDFNCQQRQSKNVRGNLSRYASRLAPGGSHNSNIGGRLQIKLGFEASTLQLIVTIVCAADLTFRSNGAARNPYAKVRARLSAQETI